MDERTGILLRPLPLLSTDLGLRMMVNATTSLSLQYTVLWVILYCQETSRYAQRWGRGWGGTWGKG